MIQEARSLRGGFIEPIAHIAFYRQEVRDFVRVGGTRRGLQHESTILRMEQRHNNAVYRRNLAPGFVAGGGLTGPGSWMKCRGRWMLASPISPLAEAIA